MGIVSSLFLNGCTTMSPVSESSSSSYYKVPQHGQSSETLSYFYEVALGSEYGSGQKNVKKWTSHIYVMVHGDNNDSVSSDDHSLVQNTLNTLNDSLPENTQFILTTDTARANLHMYIVPRAQFNSILTEKFGHKYHYVNEMSNKKA